jgi:protein disulfide-isomerase
MVYPFAKEVLFTPEFANGLLKNVILVELDYPRRTLQTAEIKNKSRLATSFGIQVSHNPLCKRY